MQAHRVPHGWYPAERSVAGSQRGIPRVRPRQIQRTTLVAPDQARVAGFELGAAIPPAEPGARTAQPRVVAGCGNGPRRYRIEGDPPRRQRVDGAVQQRVDILTPQVHQQALAQHECRQVPRDFVPPDAVGDRRSDAIHTRGKVVEPLPKIDHLRKVDIDPPRRRGQAHSQRAAVQAAAKVEYLAVRVRGEELLGPGIEAASAGRDGGGARGQQAQLAEIVVDAFDHLGGMAVTEHGSRATRIACPQIQRPQQRYRGSAQVDSFGTHGCRGPFRSFRAQRLDIDTRTCLLVSAGKKADSS